MNTRKFTHLYQLYLDSSVRIVWKSDGHPSAVKHGPASARCAAGIGGRRFEALCTLGSLGLAGERGS